MSLRTVHRLRRHAALSYGRQRILLPKVKQ